MFDEDPAVFLADFGVACACNGVSFTAILDQPDDPMQMAGVGVLSTMYQLTASRADVMAAAIKSGNALNADGTAFTVRSVMSISDGAFFNITLSRD